MILPPHESDCPGTADDSDCMCYRLMARRYVELNLAGLAPVIHEVMRERAQAQIITSLEGHATAIANEVRKRIEEEG